MIEKVALLEAELRNRDEQLAAMQEAANSDSETTTRGNANAPDLEAARNGYLAFVENLRTKLAEAMPEAKFDRPSVFPVEGPDPSRPILSRVAFRIADKNNRNGEMVIQLFADAQGTWLEPETTEIVAAFKSKPSTPPVNNTAKDSPSVQPRRQLTDVMGAGETVEVRWGDESGQAESQAPPPSPQPAPQPQTPVVPKKVMPTSRDVIIDFE